MVMLIEGRYNAATVMVDDLEETALEQVQKMMNHPAFEGPRDTCIMPDCHWGHGATIGFTMPMKDKVVPSTIGVDIGCGMLAVNFGTIPAFDVADDELLAELDLEIRKRVPMGRAVHREAVIHMINDFPWRVCERKLAKFNKHSPVGEVEGGYGGEYFKKLIERVGYDVNRAIASYGTLGGGNHFIELGQSNVTGDTWCIIHCGSRGLGLHIAKYWEGVANDLRQADAVREHFSSFNPEWVENYLRFNPDDLSDEELMGWIHGKHGSIVDWDELKATYTDVQASRIGDIGKELKKAHKIVQDGGSPLDYLEGEEAHGYIRDMIFAQTFASESRKWISRVVQEALETTLTADYPIVDLVESVHNYIDFDDTVIRKGACRAHADERVVIPYNMKDGTLLCRAKGNPDWNNSAPHGAGRAMSRTEAKRQFSAEDVEKQTEGVFMSKRPIDEAPRAYKDPKVIEAAIGPTVEITERVIPFLSLKDA